MEIMGMDGVVGWFECLVERRGHIAAALGIAWIALIAGGNRGKQKPRRLQERAGFSMKIDDRFRS